MRGSKQLEAMRQLPLDVVLEAARLCGIPADKLEARHFAGRSWKVELLSPWGWATHTYPQKVWKAREIADRLEEEGFCCAFDVLETGGFDVIFERQ